MEAELEQPNWLPPLTGIDGDWRDIEKRLLAVFNADFTNGKLTVDGCPVWWSRDPEAGDTLPRDFRHLTTRQERTRTGFGERIFDPRRSERLGWVGAIIRNCNDPAIKRWDYLEGDGQVRTYLWLEAFNFIVVLRPKTTGRGALVYVLVTAYYLDHAGSKRSYARKFEQRQQKGP